uniref:Vpu protein n=1 Tax=Human immunodeficiency virus type 1 TaxID=11676 RepID=A0A0C5JZY0_HV1|nr:vpu protein [Human immunodeficiency virus 1]
MQSLTVYSIVALVVVDRLAMFFWSTGLLEHEMVVKQQKRYNKTEIFRPGGGDMRDIGDESAGELAKLVERGHLVPGNMDDL